ncbi:vesicular glutamate transporter 2 [Elysia marginata]|uniref:Vesicular glutamate transporter 2 n=1 Tax=Elysia marginata TaxID=1093978 RepID=A0AAV4HM09_9GAST|nr:vesicular glutamate transporter 2 [Elysia marginata]
MFTSAPFWALIIAIVAMAWVDYTFMTSLPQYLKDVLDFDISEDGFLSATPSVCQFVSSLLVGPIADKIRNRGVETGTVRKIFQSISRSNMVERMMQFDVYFLLSNSDIFLM